MTMAFYFQYSTFIKKKLIVQFDIILDIMFKFIRAASTVAVLPVGYGIALNPPSYVSVVISTNCFLCKVTCTKYYKAPVNRQNGINAP